MNVLQQTDVYRFAEVADRYCTFLEQEPFPIKNAFLLQVAGLLAELYCAGLSLLAIQSTEETVSDERVLPEQTDAIPLRIAAVLAEHDLYWEVFNPYDREEPVAQTLNDDLADIYREIKPGLFGFDGGGISANLDASVWQWREGFVSHWGDHAVDALRVLHRALCAPCEA